MTVQSDVTAAFAELELTVPVTVVGPGTVARAFFERRGQINPALGVLAETDTLVLPRGGLPDAVQESQVVVGPVGADVAALDAGGVLYRVTRRQAMDVLLDTLALAGGADS